MDMPQGKHVKLKGVDNDYSNKSWSSQSRSKRNWMWGESDNGPGYDEDYDQYLPKFDIESGVLLSKTMKTANDRTNSSLTSLCLEMS